MRNYRLIIIMSAVIVGSLAMSDFAWAVNPVLSLQPSKSIVAIGETFTVNVNVDAKDRSIAAVELHVHVPTQFQAVSISAGNYLPVLLTAGAVSGNSPSIVLGSSPTTPKTGSGTLATITLKALSNPGSPVQISFASTTQIGVVGLNTSVIGSMNPTSVVVSGVITSPTPTPSNPTPTASPNPSSAIKLIRFGGDPKVYQVMPDMKIKWVPSLDVFNSLGLSWRDLSVKPATSFGSYKRAKLIRAAGNSSVYYVTEGGLKRSIPTEEIFLSYSNKWEDVVTVEQFELDAISNNILVRVAGDAKVYKLESNTKRWIPSAEVFISNNFKWHEIASINQTELNYYPLAANVN